MSDLESDHTAICKECNKEYDTWDSNDDCCSQECYNSHLANFCDQCGGHSPDYGGPIRWKKILVCDGCYCNYVDDLKKKVSSGERRSKYFKRRKVSADRLK